MTKERRKQALVVDGDIKKYIKVETILMSGILMVMSWAGWNLQQMQIAIKELSQVAVSNQVKIDNHVHDERAHLPIKQYKFDD